MGTRAELIKEIEAFLEETGMPPTSFGINAVGDRALMISLKAGRDPKLATADKIRNYMAAERKRLAKKAERKRRHPSKLALREPVAA